MPRGHRPPPRASTTGTTRASCWPSAPPRRGRRGELFAREFLLRRPLLEALEHDGPGRAADRRDRPRRRRVRGVPARVPVDFQVTIPELGTITAARQAAGRPHLEPHARAARRAQAPLPLPLDRLPEPRARGRDRPRAAARRARGGRRRACAPPSRGCAARSSTSCPAWGRRSRGRARCWRSTATALDDDARRRAEGARGHRPRARAAGSSAVSDRPASRLTAPLARWRRRCAPAACASASASCSPRTARWPPSTPPIARRTLLRAARRAVLARARTSTCSTPRSRRCSAPTRAATTRSRRSARSAALVLPRTASTAAPATGRRPARSSRCPPPTSDDGAAARQGLRRATPTPSAPSRARLLRRASPRRGAAAPLAAARAPTRRRGASEHDLRAHRARLAAPRRRAGRAPLPRARRAPAPGRAGLRRVRLDGAVRADAAAVPAGVASPRAARVEAFVFGTRLTRVTRELRGPRPRPRRSRRAAAARRGLVGRHADRRRARGAQPRARPPHRPRRGRRRALRRLGPRRPGRLAAEMARLRRSAHRLSGSTRSAADPRYEPLTRGMRAALPHVDHLLPGNSIASLECARRTHGGRTVMKDVLEDVDAVDRPRRRRRAGHGRSRVKRSAPRPPGAKMAVNEHGEIVRRRVRRLRRGRRGRGRREVLDGTPRRSCCTSASPTRRPGTSACRAAARSRCTWSATSRERAQGSDSEIARAGGRAALVTVLAGPAAGAKLLVTAPTASARARSATRRSTTPRPASAEELMWAERSERREEGDSSLFIDVVVPAAAAVHLRRRRLRGRAVPARARGGLAAVRGRPARALRPRRERFPDAEEVVAAWPEEAFEQLGGDRPGDRDRRAHPRPQARRRGADRSRCAPRPPTSARWAPAARRRAAASGCWPRASTEAELARISAPIGLDLGALTAEETALSIMAEIVAVRYGREGGRLRTPRAASTRSASDQGVRSDPAVAGWRAGARRRRGLALRRHQAARPARRPAAARARARARGAPWTRAWWCSATPRRRSSPPSTSRAPSRSCARDGGRGRRRRCGAAWRRSATVDAAVVVLGDQPRITAAGVAAVAAAEPPAVARATTASRVTRCCSTAPCSTAPATCAATRASGTSSGASATSRSAASPTRPTSTRRTS